ncbi:uncharacterized protein J3R85_014985 [Psidium guajava]|nr:uncharacterized protein J3R85_014985 [Psidium guajava]
MQIEQLVDSAALAPAVDEIQRLKIELEMVAQFEAVQTKHAESANMELQSLKGNLVETLSLVENMKTQPEDCEELEAHTQVPLLIDFHVEDSSPVFEAKNIQAMELLVLSSLFVPRRSRRAWRTRNGPAMAPSWPLRLDARAHHLQASQQGFW